MDRYKPKNLMQLVYKVQMNFKRKGKSLSQLEDEVQRYFKEQNKPKSLNKLLSEAQGYIKEENPYFTIKILEGISGKENTPEVLQRTNELLQNAYQAQIKISLNSVQDNISKYMLYSASKSLDFVEEYSKKVGIVIPEVQIQELRGRIAYLSTPPSRIARIEEEIKESEKTLIGKRDYVSWRMDLDELRKETQSEELTKKINELERVVLEGSVEKDFWRIRKEIGEMKKFVKGKMKKSSIDYIDFSDDYIKIAEGELKKLGREEDKEFQELKNEFGKIIPYVRIQEAKAYIKEKSFSMASLCFDVAERYSQEYHVQIPSDEIAGLRKSIERKADADFDEDYTCPDCGVKPGKKHEYGCDQEKCPICGRQLILSCNCFEEVFGEEDTEKNRKIFLKKIEKVGRIPYSVDNCL